MLNISLYLLKLFELIGNINGFAFLIMNFVDYF